MAQTSRLVIELDSRDAEAKAADTRKALEALEDAGLSIQPALNKAGAGMEKMGKGAEKATKSIEDEADELERLLGQIDPVVRRLGELDKQEQDLAKHRKAGKLDTATYDEYKAKIEATRRGLTSFDDSLTRTGNTAKQTAAALRGVPAQFTDIATSLQGGQAPLTVLLQQGGQLKDMFGGVGPAAKALGGYVAGLVNPFTLAAAAAVALGVAYNKGSQEADAYNNALILTGRVAGTTADALSAMAREISGNVGTTGAAAEVLAQLAGSGKIAASSFEVIATAALSMKEATGRAVEETVAEFVKIGKDPVAAAKELNDQYHFLTESIYSQIVAAKESGNTTEASRLLTEAYANAIQNRTTEITGNLGLIERAWKGIKSAAAEALDATLSVGRMQTMEQQAEAIRERLKTNQGRGGRAAGLGIDTRNTEQDKKDLDYLEMQIEAEKVRSKYVGDRQKVQDAGISAAERVDALTKSAWTNEQKRGEEIKKYKADLDAIREANPNDARLNQSVIDKQLANINDKYKDAKAPKAKAYTEDAGLKMLDAARQTNAVLLQQSASINGQGIATQKLGVQAQALIKWEQQLADIKGKQTLTADQKSLLASQDLITAQLKKNVALEREAEISKSIQQAQKDQVQLLTLTGQLREANSLKSSLDDAAQLAEYERQGNTEAAKRLETLIKIRDINLSSAQKPGTIEGVTKAPTSPGLDASVGGAGSEIDRLDAAAEKLEQWRVTELERQAAYLDLKAINEETYAARVANIDQQAQDNRLKIEGAKNQALLVGASDFFGNMAALSQSENKKLAVIGKAAAITQATIDGYVAVQKALAAFPPPFNFAAAAAVGVATAANVANIAGIGFSGGGYTGAGGVNDPAGTVHKGEVVWSQTDIRKAGGVATVEAMRKGNVSPIRPGAKGTGPDASRPQAGAAPVINIIEDASKAGQSQSRSFDGKQYTDYFVANIRENGKEAKAIQQMLGMGRAAR